MIVMDGNKDIAPEKFAYGSAPNQIIKELPCNGIGTDKYYSPIPLPDIKWLPYSYKVMSIDPSGRGKDELAYSIVAVLNAQIFLLKQGGLQGGYCEQNLTKLAKLAKEYDVNKLKIESNFGDGMFTTLLQPILRKIHPCAIEEVRHNTQKEARIIDTLEPVMLRHKLVVNTSVIQDDYKVYERDQQYSFIYQMTRLSRDKGALAHDDRLDVVAMAVAHWLSVMDRDSDTGMEELLEEQLEQWLDPERGVLYIPEPPSSIKPRKRSDTNYEGLTVLSKFYS